MNIMDTPKEEEKIEMNPVTPELNDVKWYVIRCYSAQEKKAKKHIESQLRLSGLEDMVLNLILPTRKENYIRKGKKATREVNFFPGYLLIQSRLEPEILHIINNTDGVMNMLGGWQEIKDENTGKKIKKYICIFSLYQI